jgi:dipeptidyl aminopeptidase/acylaminoacyl peptidase
MKPNPHNILAFLLGVLLLSSCGSLPNQLRETPTASTVLASPVAPTTTPGSIPFDRPSATPNQPAGAALTAQVPARETSVEEELPVDFPLSIEHLRKGKYPGSTITFEEELERGNNYGRYYVSYLSEGLKIYALMTIPDGEPPGDGWPVIIFNHGYIPPALYETTERYVEYVDRLARSDYIVFRSDYRGHARSEGEAVGAYGYPDYTIDVLNAVASMKAYPDSDPDRIGMWGHSMGGYITLRCMVISEDIKVGVIWAGVVGSYPDMVYNWPEQAFEVPERANNWRTALAAIYGTPAQNPVFWDAISANSYLTDLSGPIQLHHGTGDIEVPLQFSGTLYQQMLTANIPAELFIYENDNHNLSNSFDTAMRRTIQYFDRYLKVDLE